jgi:hypothetical protein
MARMRWSEIAILLCLSSFALLPLLMNTGLLLGHDALLHIHRMAEIQTQWSQGILIPQWADRFYGGYGAPTFIFYAPLVHYLGAFLLSLGLSAIQVSKLIIGLAVILSSLGMYSFMRQHIRAEAAIFSALCYVYAPFLLFTEAYTRGNYPEMFAFALFPLVLACFTRLITYPTRWMFIACCCSLGALMLSHNLLSVVMLGILGAWIILKSILNQRVPVFAYLALAIGVGISAYLIVPVFAERDLVRIADVEAFTRSRIKDFFGMFISLERLFGIPYPMDWGANNDVRMAYEVGSVAWVMAIVGVLGCFWQKNNRWIALFWLGISFGCIMLIIPEAYPIWQAIPSLSFLTFPWRLVGMACLGLSILAGFGLSALLNFRWAWLISTLAILSVITSAVSLLFIAPRHLAIHVGVSLAEYMAGEQQGIIARGTTSYNEFLPKSVPNILPFNPILIDTFITENPNSLPPNTLPDGVSAILLSHNAENTRWQISTPNPVTLVFQKHYFVGWIATLNDTNIPIRITSEGLISVDIPSGTHTFSLTFMPTPERILGRLLSVFAVISIGVVVFFIRRTPAPQTPSLSFNWRWGMIVFILQSVILFVVGREGIAWFNSPLGTAQPVSTQVPITFQSDETTLQLLGWTISSREVAPDGQLEVVLYWYGAESLPYPYASFIHFGQPNTPPIAQLDTPRVGELNFNVWTNSGYQITRYTLNIPANTPLNTYSLTVGVYTCATRPTNECGNGDRLEVYEGGKPIGDVVTLGRITVR